MNTKTITNILLIISFCVVSNMSGQDWIETYWEHLEIYRDDWGIPHIFAENPRVLAFGFGYTQAQDHWESMLLSYRLANGKLSEVLGESEELSDRFSIQVGHRRFGSLAYSNCDSLTRDICEGFAEGVNTWILENRDKLPDWIDGVQPQDIFALWHAFIISMAPLDMPSFQKRPPAMKSGFAFTVSREKSREDTPLFAFSSHQFYPGPFRWYEAHLICGEYNVYGCTIYGLPILLQGHTLKHAWAITPNVPDISDVFIESIHGNVLQNPKSVYLQGNQQNKEALLLLEYMSRSEEYYVKTPNGMDQRFVPVQIGQKGPLLLGSGNEFFSWKIGGYEDIGMFFQLWEMGRANSLEKFKQAIYLHQIPMFHILYADSSNNLFYFYSAKSGTREIPPGLPEKDVVEIQNLNWTVPISSRYYQYGWRYLIPPDVLPSFQNPTSGYLQVCGGPPTSVTDDIKLPSNDSLNKLIHDTENVISRRVKSVLRTDERSLREFQSLILDTLSSLAIETLPRIIDIGKSNQQRLNSYHPDLPSAVEILSGWDYRINTDSSAPVLFYLWNHFFARQPGIVPSIEIEPYFSLMNKRKEIEENCLEALADAVRYLRNNRDTLNINWGDIHRIQKGANEYPVAGSETMGATFLLSELPPENERWGKVEYGIGFASVIKLGTVIESYSIMPFGNSESIESPHYQDQWNLFNQRQMKKTRFYPEDIYRFAEVGLGRKLVFIPKGAVGEIRCVSSSKVSITIQSKLEPPAPLPENYVPFSVFITPEYLPKEANVQFLIRLFIPNDICSPENLNNLSLYALTLTNEWKKIENQNVNAEAGFLEGIFNGKQTIAILGAEEFYSDLITNKEVNNLDSVDTPLSINKGIFSTGLPGEIPKITQQRKVIIPSSKQFQSQEILPKAMDIPPIEANDIQKEMDKTQDKNTAQTYESIPSENTNKKRRKISEKIQTQKPIVKKNFTIRKN